MVGARVEGMLAVGAKRSKIYDYLLEHDQNVIKADVDNMVQDFASSVSSLDDNDATAAEVGALAAADPENCVSIAETETGETGVISLSTAFMRKTFSRFGEVLLVDCTHKTNRHNYQLLTFMVNRLESFFGKLKDVINSSMSMAQCVEALVAGDKRAENEYKYRLSRIGRFVNTNYDEEMSNMLRFTTHFVAEQIEPQYAAALSKTEAYGHEPTPDDPDEMLVRGRSTVHRLNTNDWRCDCEFARSMRLPCRHAIAYRKHMHFAGPVISCGCIDERWTSPVSNLQCVRQVQYQDFDVNSSTTIRKKPRTHADRYKAAVRATHLIASELADLADEDEFEDMLGFVLQQWRNVRQKHNNVGGDAPAVREDESSCESKVQDGAVHTTRDPSPTKSPVKARPKVRINPKARQVGRQQKQRTALAATDENIVEHESVDPERDASPAKSPVQAGLKVRINQKARKVGRPQKQRSVTVASERADRKWYKAAEQFQKNSHFLISSLCNKTSFFTAKPALNFSPTTRAVVFRPHY